MSDAEMLFLIMVTSLITSIINCIEIISLIRSSKRTNEILENPAPVVSGFLHALEDDKDFARDFGVFLVWAGRTGISGVKEAIDQAGIDKPKFRRGHLLEDIGNFAISIPGVQDAIQERLQKAVAPKVQEQVDNLF